MTNSRFEELERRCARLKKVRIIRIVFIITSLFLIGFGSYYWMNPHLQEPLIAEKPIIVPLVVEIQASSSDINESNVTVPEKTIAPQMPEEELLFLAPRIYKSEAKSSVNETKALSEETQLLKNFNAVQNFDNAYAYAYFYFERQSYGDVIIWAKETSKYNSRSEKPWILYAKAKFALGDRAEAIRSLELFLSYINSTEVQELLNVYKGQE
jgi:hypothetical protein